MKKVLFYLSDFQSGGTEWFALRLARAIKDEDLQPLFLACQKKGELIKPIRSEFETTILNGSGYTLLSQIKTLPAMARYIKKEKPDTLISGLTLLNATAAIAKKLFSLRYKLIVVEHMRLTVSGSFLNRMRQRAKRFLTRWTHHQADHIVCVSQTVLDDVQSLAGTKNIVNVSLIYNPIIPDNLSTLMQEPIQHRWIRNKETPLLLAIGRLLPIKDFKNLLHAFSKVIKEKPARLIILGEGVDLLSIEILIDKLDLSDYVSMPGSVHNVFPYLKAADLFALSSKEEAFGNVLAEALACGTPVVSTDCGGPREVLSNGAYGTLVSPEDSEELARAILKALSTSHNKDILKARGLDFSSYKAARAYKRLLN